MRAIRRDVAPRRAASRVRAVCAVCETPYTPRTPAHRTCGRECSNAALGTILADAFTARQRAFLAARTVPDVKQSKCSDCGATTLQGRRKCDACVQSRRSKRRRQDKRRRRALRRGVVSEPYALAEIAARDKFMCGLCGKRVAMTKTAPDPRSPSIDHMLPLSCGGDDTRANVHLAHFGCNVLKRDKGGGEQLALVG